jgi:hypothetical protein
MFMLPDDEMAPLECSLYLVLFLLSNNAGIVGLAYTQALRPGVKASFGIAIDTQRLNDRKWASYRLCVQTK